VDTSEIASHIRSVISGQVNEGLKAIQTITKQVKEEAVKIKEEPRVYRTCLRMLFVLTDAAMCRTAPRASALKILR
jgi:hypothetical protein